MFISQQFFLVLVFILCQVQAQGIWWTFLASFLKIPRIYPKCYVMVNFYDEIYFLGIKLRSRSVPLSYCITETIMDLYSLLQTNEISEIFKAVPKLFIKKKFQNSKCRYSLLTCFVIFFLKHKQLGTHCYSSSIFFIKVSRYDSK